MNRLVHFVTSFLPYHFTYISNVYRLQPYYAFPSNFKWVRDLFGITQPTINHSLVTNH